MSEFLVGIDAGGTKCELAVWKTEVAQQLTSHQVSESEIMNAALFHEKFPGINLDVTDHWEAGKRLAGMLEQAASAVRLPTVHFLDKTKIIMGLAGLDTSEDQANAEQWLHTNLLQLEAEKTPFTLLPDVELALWSASPTGQGIVLIAGTGSNCFGRDASSHKAKTGGMSSYFSDEGSGFILGWEALHLVAKMNDGRLPKTKLYQEILNVYSVTTFSALKSLIINASDSKKTVAQAAPVVQKLAAQGEENSLIIIKKNLQDLGEMVITVAEQLDAQSRTVFLVGSLFRDDFYRQQLTARLFARGIHSQPLLVDHPVTGVIRKIDHF